MEPREAYNSWAAQYDSNENKTRDLEAISLREMLRAFRFDRCLELGCGTGKNTGWLLQISNHVTAVDFSDEMLAAARKKITAENVEFVRADLKKTWPFELDTYDIAT